MASMDVAQHQPCCVTSILALVIALLVVVRDEFCAAFAAAQFTERGALDLPDALAADAELAPDFRQGVLARLGDAEAQIHD